MTWLQWFLIGYGVLYVYAAVILNGTPRKDNTFNGTMILINLATFQWLMWYAGAWN